MPLIKNALSVFLLFFLVTIFSDSVCQAQLPINVSYKWRPPVIIPVGVNNNLQYWGFAYSNPPHIEYNLKEIKNQGLSEEVMIFMRVHEHGHILIPSSDEVTTDCWATKQLAASDPAILDAAISWVENVLGDRGGAPGRGTGHQRAALMRMCRAGTYDNGPSSSSGSPSWSQQLPPVVQTVPIPYEPERPGKRLNRVVNDSSAELALQIRDKIEWQTSLDSPYAKYRLTIRNPTNEEISGKTHVVIDLANRSTRKITRSGWNVDEKSFSLKGGESKEIEGKLMWFANKDVMPALSWDIYAFYSSSKTLSKTFVFTNDSELSQLLNASRSSFTSLRARKWDLPGQDPPTWEASVRLKLSQFRYCNIWPPSDGYPTNIECTTSGMDNESLARDHFNTLKTRIKNGLNTNWVITEKDRSQSPYSPRFELEATEKNHGPVISLQLSIPRKNITWWEVSIKIYSPPGR